ncbi:MAG: hypothetical protein EBR82_01390 [Caulobacteraceae bacterium]|nr:hypothetical protein [Caulobacteraceae bacterium]
MATYHYLVLTKAVEGQEQAFADWYDDQHIPDCLRVAGVTGAKRYKILNQVLSPTETTPTQASSFDSLAIYEFETDDPTALAFHLLSIAGTEAMPLSPAFDRTGTVKFMAVDA